MMAETDLDKVSLHRKERRMCMKRRENKWLAMVLAGVMGVSVLAGCGSTDASKTASVNERKLRKYLLLRRKQRQRLRLKMIQKSRN